jgi:hypothetical protein
VATTPHSKRVTEFKSSSPSSPSLVGGLPHTFNGANDNDPIFALIQHHEHEATSVVAFDDGSSKKVTTSSMDHSSPRSATGHGRGLLSPAGGVSLPMSQPPPHDGGVLPMPLSLSSPCYAHMIVDANEEHQHDHDPHHHNDEDDKTVMNGAIHVVVSEHVPLAQSIKHMDMNVTCPNSPNDVTSNDLNQVNNPLSSPAPIVEPSQNVTNAVGRSQFQQQRQVCIKHEHIQGNESYCDCYPAASTRRRASSAFISGIVLCGGFNS